MKKMDGHRLANALLIASAVILALTVAASLYLRHLPLPLPKDRPPGVAS